MKFNFLLLKFFHLFIVKKHICHLLFVLLFEKKCYKHRQRKKKKTIHTFKKKREYNRHRDIQKTQKNQIMDYYNTDDGFGK